MKKQDIFENQAKIVYLGIGSNLGDKRLNIEKAKTILSINGVKILNSSKIYESLSWPNTNFPKYFNIIIKTKTYLKPLNLFYIIKKIEKILGRKKNYKNFPRTCDIDIIDYNNINKSFKKNKDMLILPHPRSHKRNFVLLPLYEINKDWKHPKFKSKITKLIMKLPINDLSTIKLI